MMYELKRGMTLFGPFNLRVSRPDNDKTFLSHALSREGK